MCVGCPGVALARRAGGMPNDTISLSLALISEPAPTLTHTTRSWYFIRGAERRHGSQGSRARSRESATAHPPPCSGWGGAGLYYFSFAMFNQLSARFKFQTKHHSSSARSPNADALLLLRDAPQGDASRQSSLDWGRNSPSILTDVGWKVHHQQKYCWCREKII